MSVAIETPILGHVLTLAERAVCAGALQKVALSDSYNAVSFWGKIQGTEGDYLIAQSWTLGESIQKAFFFRYDTRCTWLLNC